MANLFIETRVAKFIEKLPPKHAKQVSEHLFAMQKIPVPVDARSLVGQSPYMRTTIGEYRIVFKYESEKDLVSIVLIGKRNDDEVYKRMKRLLK